MSVHGSDSVEKRKIAIIGASYLQEPLIRKANEMGIETHVFAWQVGDVGESIASFFYPISIVDKEAILDECRRISIDGICSIASDLAMKTVNYVAQSMNLTSNSMFCTELSTNKFEMRKAFEINGDPSPKSILVDAETDLDKMTLKYPVIIKPIDRSGSRGITKAFDLSEVKCGVERALQQSFEKKALLEEYVDGKEYSVEYISWKGIHFFLALTQKYTTGSPHFIETGHLEPAQVDDDVLENIKSVVSHALNSLKIEYGASHSEIKINSEGDIKIIEIGGRMGGDFIGSGLVQLSTGIDFVKAVIDISLGNKPVLVPSKIKNYSAVRFVFGRKDIEVIETIREQNESIIVSCNVEGDVLGEVTDSSTRHGYCLIASESLEEIEKYIKDL